MNLDKLYGRYQELQEYVGWTKEDADRVRAAGPLLEPFFVPLIDDFYDEIERHPDARKVITGGQAQIDRLKGTLRQWLRELVSGKYDRDYLERRWRVGWRHVEIGLDQVYTNVALSRLRSGLTQKLQETWREAAEARAATVRALNKLLDLDLAIIEDAYQAEHLLRQQRVERLATIGQVAGGVAHELRNPLNVVKTSVYYLLNAHNPSPQKTAEHLQRIERHVGVADNVIKALSSFTKLPTPNLHTFAVDAMVHETLEINPAPGNIQVTVDCPRTLPDALADKDQIRIVLGNLVRNAYDAMANGGLLAIRGRTDGNTLVVEVVDAGVGIPPEHLSHVMEPFYSTKARGLGLGLAIARAVLDKNNGALSVVSQLGRGSTFTMRLAAQRSHEIENKDAI